MSEEEIALVLDEAKEAMAKSLRSFRIELQKVRTGRANPAILDGIQVDYYGTPTPLNQLANLSAPDPRLIVISPYDKGALNEIERAILKADLGLTPANDGKLVRIPIPALTEERRRDLVKQIKKSAEHHKIGVREARRAYRRFHAACFWSFDPDYVVTLHDVPWVVAELRKHGGRAAWQTATRLCR